MVYPWLSEVRSRSLTLVRTVADARPKMRFTSLELEILDRTSEDWTDSRIIHSRLAESGHAATYYEVRVCLDGLQLKEVVEVKRVDSPWPGIVEVRKKC